MMYLVRGFAIAVWVSVGGMAQAQSLDQASGQQGDTPDAVDAAKVDVSNQIAGIDLTGWDTLASRAETMAESNRASKFALDRIRAELAIWRDKFTGASSVNAYRLATVAAQMDALTVPEDTADPDPVIDARMATLTALQNRLKQPQLLVQEAYVRANGLIAEIDRQLRIIETRRLMTRGESPLVPSAWPAAFTAVKTGLATLASETWAIGNAHRTSGTLLPRVILASLGLVAGLIVVARARGWIALFAKRPIPTSVRGAAALRFLLSLASVIIPVIALVLVAGVLLVAGLFGIFGQDLITALPFAGALVLASKWLADFYFPQDPDDDGVLGYGHAVRMPARRLTVGLGWALAVLTYVDLFDFNLQGNAGVAEIISLPVQIVIGVLLWGLGRFVAQPARADTPAIFTRSRLRVYIGGAAQVFAIAGPFASAIGYGAAASSITIPAVVSLAVIAVIVVLQRLSYAIAVPKEPVTLDATVDPDPRGLLPVSINFGLILIGVPVLALVWGASWAELIEVWARFLKGFSIGETQISPSNFLTFILVFMIGVLIVRFIKSTLKTTVMPRTKFDLGGQNAVVAGIGYVGVFVSALVAFGVAGIDLSSIAIVAGALSVGIGFGLQNIVSNFVSGIILLIERPVGEGDMIEVGGKMGYVRDISVRSTRIETFDRTDVIIPNADLVSNQVTNWTRGNLVGRASIPVGVAYGTDTTKVFQILQDITESHPLVLVNPPPNVLLLGFGASSIDFEIRAIIRDVNFVMNVKSEILQSIVEKFNAAGIEIPYPQRDIWLRNPEALHPKDDAAK